MTADSGDKIPDPSDFSTASGFKEEVYDRIEKVPTWMFDLKLSIIWREAHDRELEDYMKAIHKDYEVGPEDIAE